MAVIDLFGAYYLAGKAIAKKYKEKRNGAVNYMIKGRLKYRRSLEDVDFADFTASIDGKVIFAGETAADGRFLMEVPFDLKGSDVELNFQDNFGNLKRLTVTIVNPSNTILGKIRMKREHKVLQSNVVIWPRWLY